MDSRTRLYVSGFVAALAAYILATVAFTGVLNLIAATVFAVAFIIILAGFERFVMWAETLESTEPSNPQA